MCKPNEKHWEIIFNYFDIYPEMPTGRINAGNGKHKMKMLWEELSTQLNSLGYGTKSPDKWQKTWIDFKCNLKKKASNIKKVQDKTGGGPAEAKVLNEFELRALEFLGQGFIHGVGSAEVGLKQRIDMLAEAQGTALIENRNSTPKKLAIQLEDHGKSKTEISESFSTNYGSNCKFEKEIKYDSKYITHIAKKQKVFHDNNKTLTEIDLEEENPASCTNKITFDPAISNKESKNSNSSASTSTKASAETVQLGHNYVPHNKNIKKNEQQEYHMMYAETISVLKEINNTVDRRLGQIYEVLRDRLPKT